MDACRSRRDQDVLSVVIMGGGEVMTPANKPASSPQDQPADLITRGTRNLNQSRRCNASSTAKYFKPACAAGRRYLDVVKCVSGSFFGGAWGPSKLLAR
jgi:hypothetical protein